jgi:hypothetical protein
MRIDFESTLRDSASIGAVSRVLMVSECLNRSFLHGDANFKSIETAALLSL